MKPIVLIMVFVAVVVGQTARNFRSVTFSQLGSPASGNETRKCTNCTIGDPCTGGGTGAYAYASPTGDRWICTSQAPGGGSGSVSSVATNNSVSGLTASVSNPTTTATINLSGTPNIAGTNITSGLVPTARLGSGSATGSTVLYGNQTWGAIVGSVTSVALVAPLEFTVSGSPVTGAGTLTFSKANQNANLVYAGPSSGAAAGPTFRTLVEGDTTLSDVTTNNATSLRHGFMPKLTGNGSDCVRGDGSISTCPGAGTGGDFSTNTTTSAAQQVMVASGTGGKTGQFSTVTGLGALSSGVLTGVTTSAGISSAISDEVGAGFLVFNNSPTILTPTIASFANSNHNHTNSAGGGLLALTAFSTSTGSGAAVGQTSPTLITPSLGVAVATSINKVAITAPATSATLTIVNGKTLTVNNSVTIAGTDGTVLTGPATSANLLTTAAPVTVAQGGTGAASLTSNAVLKGAGTSAVVASGVTVDSSNNVAIPGTLTMNTPGAIDNVFTIGGGVQLTTGSQPACNATNRFIFWVVAGGGGVKDTVQVCAKDVADSYAWRTIY